MDNGYFLDFEVLWCFIDANGHMRHTGYSDFATCVRVKYLKDMGHGLESMNETRIGPVVLREFIEYRREVKLGDAIRVFFELSGESEDKSLWQVRHNIYRLSDKKLSCVIDMQGAWFDLNKRKISSFTLNDNIKGLSDLNKTKDFKILNKKSMMKYTI